MQTEMTTETVLDQLHGGSHKSIMIVDDAVVRGPDHSS